MRISLMTLALFAIALDAGAAGARSGSWDWQQRDTSYFAGTSNENGDVFGEVCYLAEHRCAWLVGIRQPCATSSRYPVLVNSDGGARSLELVCVGQDEQGLYQYSIGEFDEIDSIVARTSRLGLAMPLRGDQFLLVKFDLVGSGGPVAAMRRAAEAKMQQLAAPK